MLAKHNPRIAITIGDPSGIGPEVVSKALADYKYGNAEFIVIGDSFALRQAARKIGTLPIFSNTTTSVKNGKCPYFSSHFSLIDLKNIDRKNFAYGKISAHSGKAAIEYIETAVGLIFSGRADALVTAPINKEAVNRAGFKWPGHTEFLAHLAHVPKFCMMLAGGPLKVVLATRHIALRDVCKKLNTHEIYDSIILTAAALKKYFSIKNPKIAVCALNPHAGEGGLFSDEEKRIIAPAIKKAKLSVPGIAGPLPADSLFYRAYRGEFDAEIVMYHDQGLIPFKMIAKDIGVNVTLGLPFVRTSPAHGTAFDIAGNNKANPSSMIEAIKMAIRMVRSKWKK